MTLLDTENIGKSLVKYGFNRNSKNHQIYHITTYDKGSDKFSVQYWIEVIFKVSSGISKSNYWYATVTYHLYSDVKIVVTYNHVFKTENILNEGKQFKALYEFLKS
jgi:hypothetical protein